MKRTVFVIAVAIMAVAGWLISQPAPPKEQVGPVAGGGFLLNSGWKITPAGRQIPLDTMPMSSVLSKDGKFLLVLNGGYNPPSISVLRVDTMQELGRTPVKDGWLGLSFSPDGKLLYVGGGSEAAVFEFRFNGGVLTPARTITLIPQDQRKPTDFIGDVAISPDNRLLYAADLPQDRIHIVNLQTGVPIEKIATGRRPYRILFHPDGKSFLVSSWADGAVYHHKAETGERLAVLRLGQHPTDMVWRARLSTETGEQQLLWTHRLFVAAANTNSVFVVGVNEGKDLQRIETINVSMTPRQPLGMTPTALALNADESRLFVVCSDANAVAVADLSQESTNVLGFIPTGWYPTAVRSIAGNRLVIFNGRGLRSLPNPKGPNPNVKPAPVHLGNSAVQYVGRLQTGTASLIEPFDETQLDAWSDAVTANSPYRDERLEDSGSPAGNPVPRQPGQKSPIEHVIYVVKENRTYDQVLGDLGKGNGDPSLTLFPEKVSPNHHKLARDFVLFDNFYVNADVSADGHNWSTSGIANDYVQKMWPNSYGGRRRHYDYEGGEPAAYPPAGYIWTNAAAAGVSMRNYGWWATNTKQAAPTGQVQIEQVRDPNLAKVTNLKFRSFDLDYADVERMKVFLEDLKEFEKTGTMPQLLFVRIGNDHTSALAAGKVAPLSAMADNDHALGMLVEAVSKSKFWPKTAIFVLEDDAQNGPDHVDSHRSPAYVISPYTRRGIIDSSMYNTTSMLRTIELILGLRPMTHFDAGARPMWAAFAREPDTKPWQAAAPSHPLDERNPGQTAAAARSAKLDLAEADRIDDDEVNDLLWRAIRKSEPPPPVRSWFSR